MNEHVRMISFFRMGGICAYLAGFAYLLIVICAFISPPSIASYVASKQYFFDFKSYHNYFIFLKCFMVIANVAMIGLVIAFFPLKEPQYEGWLMLSSVLAIIGFGTGILQSIVDATQIPHLALKYNESPPIIQHVIIAFGVANPSIYALSLGIPGIWFILINALLIKKLPKFLVFLGISWGVGSIITVIAHMFVIIWMIYLIAAGALIVAPFWGIWQARYFLKKANEISH